MLKATIPYMFVNPVYGNFRKLIHTMHILATHFILIYIYSLTKYQKSHIMKKAFILILASAALLTSCAKSDKCKCTFTLGPIELKDQIIPNETDKNCSQFKADDIKAGNATIDVSALGTIKCVNYND